jgi:hypothetical protein
MDYEQHRVLTHERPRYLYEYYVTGTGLFPVDMLRHDSCWPTSGEEAAKIEWTFTRRLSGEGRRRQSIKMRSYRPPTVARWQSFTWSVSAEKPAEATEVAS